MVAANQSNTESGSGPRTYDFTPVDFDGSKAPPEAAPGKYHAQVTAVKVSKTGEDKGSFPMVIVEYTLMSTEDESPEAQESIGAPVADFLTFFKEGDSRQKMGKLRYREYCDKFELGYDIVPLQLRSKADFESFVDRVNGQELDIWITVKTAVNGDKRTTVHFTEPRGGGNATMAPLDEGDEVEEAPTPARGAKKAAVNGAGAKGKSKR